MRYTVDHVCGCWLWTGRRDRNGYAMTPQGRVAHRVLYEQRRGQIPDGFELDHECKRRECVRPEHMRLVTRRENAQRTGRRGWRMKAREKVCPKGHDYYRHGRRTAEGGKVCLVCAPLETTT